MVMLVIAGIVTMLHFEVRHCRFYMLSGGGDGIVTVLYIVRLLGSTCPI